MKIELSMKGLIGLRREKMVKFAYLLVLSALIIWLAGSGCIGNDTSKSEGSGADQNVAEAVDGVAAENLEIGLTQAEIKEVDTDLKDLDYLLQNASLEEDIVSLEEDREIDEIEMEKK
jgi:hypothetical protein